MNCRGIGEQKKRRDIMHFIRQTDYGVVFLQDTHLTVRSLPYFNCLWKGKCYHSCFSSRSRGTSILIRNNIQHNLISEVQSDCGNYVIAVCEIGTDTYAFVNMYGPNNDSPSFFLDVGNQLDQFDVDHTVFSGDYNFVIDPNPDSLNYVDEHNIRAKQTFLQIANAHGLIDIWRATHPTEQKYTWRRKHPLKCGRLDMFFVSEHLQNVISDTNILPGYRTDHNIITMTLQTRQQQRGNGLWKFNTSHLADDAYVQTIKECIYNTIQQYAIPVYDNGTFSDYSNYPNLQLTISECLFYETLIMVIRGESVKYSKQKARRLRELEKNADNTILEAQNKFDITKAEHDAINLDNTKNELEEIRRPKIEGLIIRSRAAWHQWGEKNSNYFLSLEKRNYSRKSIQYLEDGNRKITQTDKILDRFTQNMQSKYTSTAPIGNEQDTFFVSANVTCKLNATDKTRLDQALTLQDLTSALRFMKKGKSPGSNGFPVEFFRTFWSEIGPFLHRAFVASLTLDLELPTHREGIITLIPKQNRPLNSLKGWRPITLLNVDYKIISAAIASRFQSVMEQLISNAQTAYIPGRYIGENTRLVFDTLTFVKDRKMPSMILTADFEAAYESVSWSYLKLVMEKMNFGQNFMKMVDALYSNPSNQSRIILNGYLGEKIHLQRGIRQGDPASGYLFNLAVAALTEQVARSTNLTGIRIEGRELRISQYADDTLLLLDGTVRSLKGALDELVEFSKISGLNINIEKTSCMPIGTLRKDELRLDVGVKFVDEVKILGICFNRDVSNIAEKTYG